MERSSLRRQESCSSMLNCESEYQTDTISMIEFCLFFLTLVSISVESTFKSVLCRYSHIVFADSFLSKSLLIDVQAVPSIAEDFKRY